MRINYGLAKAFMADALASGTDECILWPFSVDHKGYPHRKLKPRSVCRAICQQVHGDAPSPTYDTAHACGVRRCVNPRHLRWATRTENQLDRFKHGTAIYGEAVHSARLTEADVLSIRTSSETHREIASRYNVHRRTVTDVINKKTWRHI